MRSRLRPDRHPGEEVRDPARTIPRSIPIALGITLVIYAVVAVAALSELGAAGLASATAPLAEAVGAAGFSGFEPVRAGAAVAALGSLLALIPGVPHHAGDGARPASAAPAGRRASAVRQPAPRRTGGRSRRRGRRRAGRRARRDRLLVVRGAALLRNSQCGGTHAGRQGHSRHRSGRLPIVGRPTSSRRLSWESAWCASARSPMGCAGCGKPPPRWATS